MDAERIVEDERVRLDERLGAMLASFGVGLAVGILVGMLVRDERLTDAKAAWADDASAWERHAQTAYDRVVEAGRRMETMTAECR